MIVAQGIDRAQSHPYPLGLPSNPQSAVSRRPNQGITMPVKISAYAAQSATTPLAPFSINRRDPKPTDVAIDIPICTLPATNGTSRSTHACPATRSSVASRRSAAT
jgi:hypothetical protein